MCGLAGIFAYTEQSPAVNQEAWLRIRDQMQGRGPGGVGLWVSDDQRIAFAYRRLSIIDLSDAGSQPMLDPVTANQIVFNGEIDNYSTLPRSARKCWSRISFSFRYRSFTQTLCRIVAKLAFQCQCGSG